MSLIAFTGSSIERRQFSPVKKELNQKYEARVQPKPKYPAVLRLDGWCN